MKPRIKSKHLESLKFMLESSFHILEVLRALRNNFHASKEVRRSGDRLRSGIVVVKLQEAIIVSILACFFLRLVCKLFDGSVLREVNPNLGIVKWKTWNEAFLAQHDGSRGFAGLQADVELIAVELVLRRKLPTGESLEGDVSSVAHHDGDFRDDSKLLHISFKGTVVGSATQVRNY